MATNFGKTLVRRLVGRKGGLRPQAVYVHPVYDKMGPMAGNIGSTPMGSGMMSKMPMPKMPMKGKY